MKFQACLLAALLALSACAPKDAKPESAVPDYEAEALRAMQAFDSTGMVLAVMIDGKIEYLDAFGKAEEGKSAPVTKETLFPIASISKAFTTTALAILVDRGALDWDDPVQKYIPEFQMYHPWVSENFTIRDALTHRSGLPLGAGDLLFWPDGEPSADDILKALPHLKPTTGFREKYAYDNLLYVVSGEIVARVSGQSWADFVTSEILEPVGLSACAADVSRIKPDAHVVTGHERAAGASEGTPIDPRLQFAPSIAAMGGIFCPAGDVMTWAQFWIDGGVTKDGVRLISEKQANEVWTGVTPVPTSRMLKDAGLMNQSLYGLGWFTRDFEGTRMITHSGGAPGVISNFIIMPDKNIAIFASANDYRAAPHAVTYHLADALIGGQDADIIKAYGERFAKSQKSALASLSDAFSPPDGAAAPSLVLSAYIGTYRDPWYGDVYIKQDQDGLFIDMGRSEILDGPLRPYNGDQFVAEWPDKSLKADAFVTFDVKDDMVTGFTMKAVSDITDFSFDFHDLNLVKVANDAQ